MSQIAESPTMPPGESCEYMFAPGNTSCLVARSCQSCLQTSGCAISGSGFCMNASDSSRTGDDYRLASQYNLVLPDAKTTNATGIATQQAWSFPAFEAKYCAADDATCALCKQSNFWWSSSADTRFCIGQDGCVCIMACEVAGYSSSCVNTTPAPVVADAGKTTNPYYYVLVFVLPCMLILGLVYKRATMKRTPQPTQETAGQAWQRRVEARSEQRDAERQPRAGGGGAMSLSGWNKHRGELIDKENHELNSTAPPYVAAPTTPQPTEQSTPPAESEGRR